MAACNNNDGGPELCTIIAKIQNEFKCSRK